MTVGGWSFGGRSRWKRVQRYVRQRSHLILKLLKFNVRETGCKRAKQPTAAGKGEQGETPGRVMASRSKLRKASTFVGTFDGADPLLSQNRPARTWCALAVLRKPILRVEWNIVNGFLTAL